MILFYVAINTTNMMNFTEIHLYNNQLLNKSIALFCIYCTNIIIKSINILIIY